MKTYEKLEYLKKTSPIDSDIEKEEAIKFKETFKNNE